MISAGPLAACPQLTRARPSARPPRRRRAREAARGRGGGRERRRRCWGRPGQAGAAAAEGEGAKGGEEGGGRWQGLSGAPLSEARRAAASGSLSVMAPQPLRRPQ